MGIQQYIRDNSVWTPFCGCWIWTLCWYKKSGYGQSHQFEEALAHRLSYRAFRGEIPEESQILHICDVRPCVNPDHLFLGNHVLNMKDMVRKGRAAKGERNIAISHPETLLRGERHSRATLTEEKVHQIFSLRERGFFQREIGEIIGCTQGNVGQILNKKTWRHL